VDAELDDGRVLLTVRDTGHWIERPDGPARYRGNGVPLMRALMDEVELTHNGAGTAVRMARRLAQPANDGTEGVALTGKRPA
jgi:anti-sigma regulatory factor (Ser/Thr protein kinase)